MFLPTSSLARWVIIRAAQMPWVKPPVYKAGCFYFILDTGTLLAYNKIKISNVGRFLVMERMWLGLARKKYPKQWIVAVNVTYGEKNKAYGDIYLLTPDKDTAYQKVIELRKSGEMGKVAVSEGFNDKPQIGGLFRCDQ